MALLGKYVLIGEGARGSLAKQLIAKYNLAEGREPGKYGIGLKELWQVEAGEPQGRASSSTRSAGRSTARPAAARSSTISTTIWWRSASSSTSTTRTPISRRSRNSSASRRIRRSAATFEGAQAHRLRRARHHRGRLAVGAETVLPGRRADRLLGRLRQRAAHQGLAQCGAVGHAGRRACRRRRSPPAAPMTS